MAPPSHPPPAYPFSILGDALESAAESLERAASEAPKGARRAARKTRRAVGTGVYKACYGLSFGVVYGALAIARLIPQEGPVARGFRDGAEAARVARWRRRQGRPSSGLLPRSPGPAIKRAPAADKKRLRRRRKAAAPARQGAPRPPIKRGSQGA